MEPCQFLRLIVESLSLKLQLPPTSSRSNDQAGGGEVEEQEQEPYFATLQLLPSSLPSQTALLPIFSDSNPFSSSKVIFHINPCNVPHKVASTTIKLSVHTRRKSNPSCNVINVGGNKRRIGVGKLNVDLKWNEPASYHIGWIAVGQNGKAMVHMVIRSELDPRYVFQFDGEPECNPVVYLVNGGSGGVRQPVFSCRFSCFRQSTESNRGFPLDAIGKNIINRKCGLFGNKIRKQFQREQRKGWTVIIHDLSGSPIAVASMITPFVPSPGSNHVTESNPGTWLILRPTHSVLASNEWVPWGRLSAWRKIISGVDVLKYKFEIVMDQTTMRIPTVESELSIRKGGKFQINLKEGGAHGQTFMMESTIEGEGKVSRPTVQVGAKHVRTISDSAVFIALSAAIDLSMDACGLFSKELRKELCHDDTKYG